MRKSKYKKLFTVALAEDLYDVVKDLSERFDISMGEVVRNSIEQFVKDHNKQIYMGRQEVKTSTPFSFNDIKID